MSGFIPTVRADSIEMYIGTAGVGRATASSTTLDMVAFTQLPGQPSASVFTPDDVGQPIAIVGGGPVNPLMPAPWFVQGSTFVTTVAAYVSPSQVTLAAAPDTGIYNTGFATVIMYRRCLFSSDVATAVQAFEFAASIAPGTRDTAKFTVLAHDNDYIARFTTIAMGQPVYIRSTDSAVGEIFGGYIDTLTVANYPGAEGIYSWTAICASWDGIAFRRVVNPAYPKTFSDAGDVVFANIVLTYLNDEGVGVITHGSPPTIALSCPAGSSVNQLLDQVVQLISTPAQGWYWTTDAWRNFILAPYGFVSAPWDVTDGYDLLAGSTPYQVSIETTHNQMANNTFALSPNVLLNALNATILGNGTATTFNLPQPIAATPTITLNASPQTVGILGVDTGKDWYWSQGSTTLTQDAGGVVLTASDVLLVAYETESPGAAQAPNEESLTARQGIEGTSGIYDHNISISAPILPNDLVADAATYSTQFGDPATTVTAYTMRPGLAVGQTQNITYSRAGIDGSFLIATVQLTTQNNLLVWQYTAFGGANIGDAITGLVQFINRGGNTLSQTSPVAIIQAQLHQITIDHTKISGADKTNYILFFGGTYGTLKGAPSGPVAYPNGSDIYFSTTTNQTGLLDFEISYYNPETGQIGAWVRIPTVSHTVDTVIYILYGDTSLSVSLANPPGVWSPITETSGVPNANWRGVYHLTETSAPYLDSTQYANNSTGSLGAGYPARVGGPWGYSNAVLIPGTYEGIAVPGCLAGNGFSNFSGTLSVWLNFTASFVKTGDAFDAQIASGSGHGLAVGTISGTAQGVLNRNGSVQKFDDTSVTINDGAWHQVTVTMSGAGVSNLYIDGALIASSSDSQNFAMANDGDIQISGNRGGLSFEPYEGVISEPWVTQAELDADTVLTSWRNTSSPSTFYALSVATVTPPPQTTNVVVNPAGTVTHTTGALTANLPVVGNGGADIKPGTRTGNTTEFVSATGAATSGAPLLYDANGNAAAGSAGQLVPSGGSAGQVLAKNSGTNYDTAWEDVPAGDVLVNSASTQCTVNVNGTTVATVPTIFYFEGTYTA